MSNLNFVALSFEAISTQRPKV